MSEMSRRGGHGATPHCPSRGEWRDRLAHRFDAERVEPESWREDLAHLESCDLCRGITLELDPSLLFRSLAAPVPALDAAAEVASMRRAVTALRRSGRIEEIEHRSWTDLRWRDLPRAPSSRWAAAVLVALTALSLGAGAWMDDPWTALLWSGASRDASVLSRGASTGGEGGPETVEGDYGDYDEIAGFTTTGTEIPAGVLDRFDPLGSMVEDTVDKLPLIEQPFDSFGTDIYGAGVGGPPEILQSEETDIIWMANSGEHEGDLQGV